MCAVPRDFLTCVCTTCDSKLTARTGGLELGWTPYLPTYIGTYFNFVNGKCCKYEQQPHELLAHRTIVDTPQLELCAEYHVDRVLVMVDVLDIFGCPCIFCSLRQRSVNLHFWVLWIFEWASCLCPSPQVLRRIDIDPAPRWTF